MPNPKQLTLEQQEEISKAYRTGFRQFEICKMFKVSRYQVKRVTDDKWYESFANRKRELYKKKTETKSNRAISLDKDKNNPIYDPRRDGILWHDSVDALRFGDPLPGRSALDQLRQKQD